MFITFYSILPIFLLIMLGNRLGYISVFSREFWSGLESLGFYLLYPTLLFTLILKADFSGLALGKIIFALCTGWVVICLIVLCLWLTLKKQNISRPTFSSIFQSSIRWNGFIALVVAQNMFPPEGATLVALVMAVIIIPVNITTVTIVAYYTDREPNLRSVLSRIFQNPLIIGVGLGLLCRSIPSGLPSPVMETLDLISRAALGMGLLAIGAGLRLADVFKPNLAVIVPTLIKLVLFPIVVVSSALAFDVTGSSLSYVALCAAVPTAMNGYVLARQMGGDAENYAVTATLQTIISFFSIPLVLAITDQFIGG